MSPTRGRSAIRPFDQTRAAIALASRIHGFMRYVPQVTYSDHSIGAY
jgi:hypothetical protein